MKVYILTPVETLFEGTAKAVRMPGQGGIFEVRKDHAPIIAALDAGTIVLTEQSGEKRPIRNTERISGSAE